MPECLPGNSWCSTAYVHWATARDSRRYRTGGASERLAGCECDPRLVVGPDPGLDAPIGTAVAVMGDTARNAASPHELLQVHVRIGVLQYLRNNPHHVGADVVGFFSGEHLRASVGVDLPAVASAVQAPGRVGPVMVGESAANSRAMRLSMMSSDWTGNHLPRLPRGIECIWGLWSLGSRPRNRLERPG